MIKKVVLALWIFFAVGVVAAVVLFASIAYGWIGYMPAIE